MVCFRFILFLVSVILTLSDGVKVDMKGSLSLGNEVVSALKSLVNKKSLDGRRSFGPSGDVGIPSEVETEKDTVSLIVHSSFICRNIDFCNGDLGKFLNQYIIVLTKTIEDILEALISDIDKNKNQNTPKALIFEEELKRSIREIKKMLRNVDQKINGENKSYTWIHLIKRINARFQDTATIFAAHRLEGNVEEVTDIKNKLSQKLTIATSLIELNFVDELCTQHQICQKSYEVTKALNSLLLKIITASEERAKEFIKIFYETLPSTNFYYRISDVSGREFQVILQDMVYTDSISSKNVLAIVQRIVEERLNALNSKERKLDKQSGKDVKLAHVMLSDMDHFYSKHKKEPFHDFLVDFFEWTKTGGKLSSQLRRIMKDLQNSLSFEANDLVLKLVNEMRVFMEITVDPPP